MGVKICCQARVEYTKPDDLYAHLKKQRKMMNSSKPWQNNGTSELGIYPLPKLTMSCIEKETISIIPSRHFRREECCNCDSMQSVQPAAALAHIQSSGTSSVLNDSTSVESLSPEQETDPALWDDVFCDEIEFLEEVFYDKYFRSLINVADGVERKYLSKNYVCINESWGFSSIEKKHRFVTNVLLMYKAYIPRGGEGQPKLRKANEKQPSYSDRKMPSFALWN
jgi:hypothetical protein